MASTAPIRLFFWSSVTYEHKAAENYGDVLSPYIVAQLSGREVAFYDAPNKKKFWQRKPYLMAIGSIMSHTQTKALVWGSGIISRDDHFSEAQFLAVRGPLSRKRILELGYSCPEKYGDPALLLPQLYTPTVEKTHAIGFIPHYVDYPAVRQQYQDQSDCKVIDLITKDHQATTRQILSCERIISSSLHGVIVAQAYGIPAIWVRFSDKLSGDNVKFFDYFESIGIPPYSGELIDKPLSPVEIENLFGSHTHTADAGLLQQRQQDLRTTFPYKAHE